MRRLDFVRSNRLARALACAAAATGVALMLQATGALDAVENASADWRVRRFPSRVQPVPRVVLVIIDQKSLDFYARESGQGWPWRRDVHAAMIDALRDRGAALVAFDVLFTEPSEAWPEDDETLAIATAGPPRVHHAIDTIVEASGESRLEERDRDLVARRAIAVHDASGIAWRRANQLTAPIPIVEAAAAGVGSVHLEADADGRARSVEVLVRHGDSFLPTLPVAIAADLLGVEALRVDAERVLHVGTRAVPLDASGRLRLRFLGPERTLTSTSAAFLLQDHRRTLAGEASLLPEDAFDGRVVLVGTNLAADLWKTPHPGYMPGVEIQGNALAALLTSTAVTPSPWWLSPLATALFALLGAAALVAIERPFAGATFAAGLAAAHALACVLLFAGRGFMAPFAAPLAGLAGVVLLGSVASWAVEGRERRFVRKAFEQYLSPQVIEEIARDPARLRLGGVRREITVYFSDLEGFTTLGEKLEPEDLVLVLNRYFSAMTSVVLDAKGTLDKYVGDAIMAFWGAPLESPQHARLACLAALASVRRLREIAPELERLGGGRLGMRIGLNTGVAVVGNMGSVQMFNYTAMGDVVNLASRLEGVNKVYGTAILASQATREAAGAGFTWRELDLLRVKGKGAAIRVHELVARDEDATELERSLVTLQDEALAHYRARRFDAAAQAWRRALELRPGDGPATAMLSRCASFSQAPPPPDWQGEHVMHEK